MRRPGSLFLFSLLLAAAPLRAHEMPAGDLAALGRIWGIVRYAHPWIGHRDIDLDAATLKAIARVRGGATAGVAADELLTSLGDDASFVTRPCWETAAPPVDRSPRMLAGGVVYFAAPDLQARTALTTARAAIVDLRPQPGRCTAPALAPGLVPLLVRGTLPNVRLRKTRHYGYRSQLASDSKLETSFTTIDTGAIAGTSSSIAKVVFVVDDRSVIPPLATALSAAGQASFLSVGRFPLHTAIDHCQMALADGTLVTLRTSELVDADGYAAEPAAMITLAADARDSEVLAAAEQLAKPRGGRRRASGVSTETLPPYAWTADDAFATDGLPSADERILAAYRVWNIVSFFHGSRELLGDWNASLRAVITTLEHVTTRAQYELALAEIMAVVPDGASLVDAPAVTALRGIAAPPFELMPVEGKPVVTASQTAQVKPGDELLRIDGRVAGERLAELARITAPYQAVRDLAKGPAASTARFTFARPDGSQYEVSLDRTMAAATPPAPAWEILDGNIAYVDLSALGSTDELFAAVASTRAMILDLRGAPLNADVVTRLNAIGTGVASLTRVPVLMGGAENFAHAAQTIVDDGKPKYAGRTIALVDERTDVRVALALRALARTQLVGTPGAALYGEVARFVVPGNIRIGFAATELRAADGTRGLQPDFIVEPTVSGLAAGRDELLEAARTLLQ